MRYGFYQINQMIGKLEKKTEVKKKQQLLTDMENF